MKRGMSKTSKFNLAMTILKCRHIKKIPKSIFRFIKMLGLIFLTFLMCYFPALIVKTVCKNAAYDITELLDTKGTVTQA